MEEPLLIIIILGLVFYFFHIQNTDRKLKIIENKIDTLLENNGIVFDENIHVSKDVLTAITLGKKLTAIRLYRQETGAGLKEAHEVVNRISAKSE
ncbi:hypothetical protein swp_3994 [Shewanella piezotolerans WP3]|uniref:Ribosomal protein L7/L12 C-terminal domain-containing protein n=1 Tax=Shewanella piezotolerans (strain WP3 / JCM 13877) TaxID=225849 RepID=B8CSN8_SHEPW|nr:hypothetical protein [Shewanella piezotolerans]ACJ30664.1 hypothetical protein swp_3994 [Shewanella piezotolerans WP3]